MQQEQRKVSVPLRGKGRDQLLGEVVAVAVHAHPPFPSPCGEKVGINRLRYENGRIVRESFPSPCGEKVGINMS